jgi:sulfoxide reductase heme-binding subunit YedZ
MTDKKYVAVGLFLFAAYVLQYLLDLSWQDLLLLQQQNWFRIVSGSIVAASIAFQWYLSRIRSDLKISPQKGLLYAKLHKWVGALSPLIFYMHAAAPGYAYLLALSIVFFSNFILGMLNSEVISINRKWYYQGWMILHVGLSCLITTLIVLHVCIVIYYK